MIHRREFLSLPALAYAAGMTPKERVDAVLAGRKPDRPPFCFWHHFGLQAKPPAEHAKATVDFQRKFRLDLVKVMSDFPYPKGSGKAWYELKPVDNPFPAQLEALAIIRTALGDGKHYLETIFNPWNVAEKLSSKDEVMKLMREKPQALLNVLEAIAKSEASHAKKAIAGGASGIFLAIANAQEGLMTKEDYKKFSEPFDRMALAGASGAPLNTLHLHGERVWVDSFTSGWPAAAISYSSQGTGVPVAKVREKFSGVLMTGLDERVCVKSDPAALKKMLADTAPAAGAKWIAAPGCSVPDDSTDEQLNKLRDVLGG